MMSEMQSLKNQLQSITSHLQRIVECPLCLNILKYPFIWCTNGHGVCTQCMGQLKACPTCQEPFVTKTSLPLCLKSLLEALPRFFCYSDAGCEEVVEEKDDHKQFCGFRPFHCKAPDCDITVPLCKLMSHIEKSHEDYKKDILVNKTSKNFIFKLGFNSYKSYKYHTPIYSLGNWFWITEEYNMKEHRLEISYYATPIGKPVENCFVNVKFQKDKFVHSNTLKAFDISSSMVKGFDDWHSSSGNNNNEELFCKLSFPFKVLKKYFTNQYSEFEINYDFFYNN